ncbi:MAG: radical SAM protein [Euryarchaeota archaeon]|nr:radical SAM protein [Euryarchaeota archaeon]
MVKTKSICPECLKAIEAVVFERDGRILIEKECPEHGKFSDTYWGDAKLYYRAQKFACDGKGVENPATNHENCPWTCGLCNGHLSHSVLGIIDVTNRCNLKCDFCFANAGAVGYIYEPNQEQIWEMLLALRNNKPVPCPSVQMSGGEPLIRSDIVELIKLAKKAGFPHTQIATNGLMLANKPELAKELREADLNTVYLQFDGVTPEPYLKERGLNLLPEKLKVIENCRKVGLGIVLVPTLAKGVNDSQIGDMIRFAAKNADIIRGVNFQPVSFAGRIAKEEREQRRITIPDLMKLVEAQTDGEIAAEDFYPIPSIIPFSEFVSAYEAIPQVEFTTHVCCGAATYVFLHDGHFVPITRFVNVEAFFKLMSELAADIRKWGVLGKAKAILKATTSLSKIVDEKNKPKWFDFKELIINILEKRNYDALAEFHYKSLFIGCMHFQDAYNFDIERVKRCVIHYAVPDGRIIPFCAMNTIYREKIEKQFSKPLVISTVPSETAAVQS